jgi:nucleoside-diphosphate-sugar epimerase
VATYCKNKNFENFCKKFSHIEAVQFDVTDENGGVPTGSFDTVVYIAANSDPRKSLEDPVNDLAVNAGGVARVLQEVKCKKFIYFSSGAVYLKEDIPYTISKKAGEAYAQWYAKENGIQYVIVRLFEAFGPYSPERKIFRKLCEAVDRGETTFTIYGDGKNLVDPMYVEDTAKGILSIINSSKGNVIVDLCTGKPMSITEVAKAIAKIYKVDLQLSYEGEAVEQVFFKGNPAGMKKYFDFSPSISFEEGIKKWQKRKLE